MAYRVALLLLIAGVASAEPPDRLWAVPTAKVSWTAASHPAGTADPRYRLERQVGDSLNPWSQVADVTGLAATVPLLPCVSQRVRVSALGSEGPGPASDAALWIGHQPGIDCNGDGRITSTEFTWFRYYYLRRLVGDEWQ